MAERIQGRVVFFSYDGGWGIVQPDSTRSRKDAVFFHRSQLLNVEFELVKGDRIEFETVPGKKHGKPGGRQEARNITLVEYGDGLQIPTADTAQN